MRLDKMKLAGFKSFVEPTTINFTSNRTGIIGPNGCGKSNVIDAVRWVMGESSAKQLRGESMDDVIFNGSSSRPAISKASIDLIFDNSEHTLGGQYANYNEIAIRREITRDGQSQYFLNGTRCRRRDIADIFLGTGLGPRSYAIIEQGMISRIIEAKPEELRVYLEEAAGITKYKERRRETENRIRHTRDNLDRLDDLRDEIEKQLNHLKRQADAALRYKNLKDEERRFKAELLALKWRDLNTQMESDKQRLEEQQTEVEAVIAEQRSVELNIEQNRESHTEANESLNNVQAEYYRLGADISRIEQAIQHYKDTRTRQKQDFDKVSGAFQELQQHVEEDRAKLEDVSQSIAEKQPELQSLDDNKHHSSTRLAEAETAMQQWQHSWEDFNQQDATSLQSVRVEQTRLEQLKEHIERLQHRLSQHVAEQESLATHMLEEELEELLTGEVKLENEVEQKKQSLQDANNSLFTVRDHIDETSHQLNDAREEAQKLSGKLASLDALQQAALGKQNEAVVEWLETQGLAQQPRLAEQLKVQSGWEQAVETVLEHSLEAVCVDGVDAVTGVLGQLEQGMLMLVDGSNVASAQAVNRELLLDKVQTNLSLKSLIGSVYAVDRLDQALSMRADLSATESVVTRDGIWIGANWLRVARKTEEQGSVLAREQSIKESRDKLESLQQRIQELESKLSQYKATLSEQENEKEDIHSRLQELNAEYSECRAKINNIKLQLEQMQKRRENLSSDMAEIKQQIEADKSAYVQSQETLQQAQISVDQNETMRQQLQTTRQELHGDLQKTRDNAQADREAMHEIALNLEAMRSMKDSTGRNLERMQQQLDHLQTRRDELEQALAVGDQPIEEKELELTTLLEASVKVDKSLGEARTLVESIDAEIRGKETERSTLENKIQDLRGRLEQNRLEAQEVRVRCQTTKEQLDETEFEQQLLFDEMPEDATIDGRSEQVQKIEQRIQRMGPINLAAIDEHKEQSERKEYLDAQHADLTEALETLETAISKIDRETRSRFKDIFDKVNTHMSEMFPRLFGGGQAHLEMTGDDLLNTGVSIMARPPGKRISNIHLLSGGEKALTAVAMVFAIFQLNPAPFCMLDEVDAPLDEANVSRFGNLVKEMSEKVQFIVITHNKTTMEMVDQLTGVTMREAGVSRIVAVDVDEAVKLATA